MSTKPELTNRGASSGSKHKPHYVREPGPQRGHGQHVSYKLLFYLRAYFLKMQPVTAWVMGARLYSHFFFASSRCCLLRCVSLRSYLTILSLKSASREEPSQWRTAQWATEHGGTFGGLELERLACFSRLNESLAINL